MGMAASQARYLALTARKTNTEWEGQQINQARTALANQSANLFNRLLNMEVPNPPKSTDYTELQYSYSDGENESVLDKWTQLSSADPNYNYEVVHYYLADILTGSQKMMQDPQVQIGDVLNQLKYDKSGTTVEKNGDEITITYKVGTEEKTQTYTKINVGDQDLMEAFAKFQTKKGLSLNTDDVYGYQDDDGTWHFFVANEFTKVGDSYKQGDILNELGEALKANGYLDENNELIGNIYYYQDADGKYAFSEEPLDAEDTVIKPLDYTDYSTVNGPAYVGNSPLTELNELIVNDHQDQVAELTQILKDCPDTNISKYVHFDANGKLVYDGSGIYTFEYLGHTYFTTYEDLMNSYNGTYNGLNIGREPNGADRINDIDHQQPKLAYYTASYVPTRIEATEKALLETDENGRFSSVRLENDSRIYNLNVEEVTDQAAYDDAMNAYLYKKAQYEKTIADINAKTSIIQKEDRTLELRLKQLDTEQHALATEMDAVKKVIKDNVEKTFKTFSD